MASVKICIIGPESTGKSTLTKELSKHFGFPLVNEISRQYLEDLGRKHSFEDLESMAIAQANAEKECTILSKPFFCDTDLLTYKIWAQDKFDKEITFVEQNYEQNKANLYLLCYPDLEWHPDPLREDEHRLMVIYQFYIDHLEHMDVPYRVIKGTGDVRLKNATQVVSEFLSSN